jgi:C-terminal processing protease CtpA/Prc
MPCCRWAFAQTNYNFDFETLSFANALPVGILSNQQNTYSLSVDSLIRQLGVYYPDGTETQRKGVKIDVVIHPSIKGIKEGRDERLEKAIEMINTDKSNAQNKRF